MSIKMKIIIPTVMLTIVLTAVILASNILQFSQYVDKDMDASVRAASAVALKDMETRKLESKTAALYVAEDPYIIDAVALGDRDALLQCASQLQKDTGVEFCTVTDAGGTVLVRTHEPDNYGDSVSSQANVKSAMSGQCLTSVEQGSAVRLSIRSGAPIFDAQGGVIGVVSMGYRLDTDGFVDAVKSLMQCETTVFLGDERISTTVVGEDGKRAIGTKAAENVSKTVLAGNTYSGNAKILGHDALAVYSPIYGVDGKVLGMLFVGRYLTQKTDALWSFLMTGSIIIIVLLALFIPVLLITSRRIVAPINVMVKAANALASGDTDISVRINTKDEMRELAAAFNHMIENTRKQAQTIEAISGGDLTVSVDARSDKDIMNNALITMLERNNNVFSQIIGSANQVSSGAQQMAGNAQALAQASTEQTAAIEELSGVINDVDGNTKNNAALARQAVSFASTIETTAHKGSEQMGHLVQAVNDISEASRSINKIIRTIDDIASKTNILALNASVEAARAGQHGRGFAVVAEEVRNLAAKSAEAAKDTGAIIENSIAKAELGAGLADKTSESLKQIVTGIHESSRIIGEIAESSERQSASIAHINDSVKQVSQVVQQNSATAQQSAAASEEMNGQAHVLEDLVSQFKVKNDVNILKAPGHGQKLLEGGFNAR